MWKVRTRERSEKGERGIENERKRGREREREREQKRETNIIKNISINVFAGGSSYDINR